MLSLPLPLPPPTLVLFHMLLLQQNERRQSVVETNPYFCCLLAFQPLKSPTTFVARKQSAITIIYVARLLSKAAMCLKFTSPTNGWGAVLRCVDGDSQAVYSSSIFSAGTGTHRSRSVNVSIASLPCFGRWCNMMNVGWSERP